MRILLFLLFPIFLQAQINRAYGVIEIGSTFPSSSSTGPKFAYRPADSAFYRWQHTNVWIKIVEPSIIPDTLYLQQISGTTAIVNGDTINLTPYVLKTDTTSILAPYIKLAGWGLLKSTNTLTVDSTLLATKTFTNRFLLKSDSAAMLTNYPSTVGYGILKSTKTIRADTTSPNGLATRLFTKTLPTSIITGRIAVSDGSNLVGYSNFNYTDTRPTLTFGNSTVSSSTTPAFIDMGGTFSSAAGANPKLALYNSGGVTYGFGISAGQLDYITPISGAHSFYIGGSRTAYINSTSIRLPTSKTIKFDAAGASATTPMIDMSSGTAGFGVESGYLTYIAPTGVGHNFYVNGSVAARITSTSNLLLGTTTDVPTSILTVRSTIKSSSPFPLHTLAESDAITGVQGNFDYETTQNGLRWYNGTRKAYALESTFARGTSTYVPFFDANGQLTEHTGIRYNSAASDFGLGGAPSAQLHLQGNKSAPTWQNTGGIGFRIDAATYTNTTSSGSFNDLIGHSINNPTFSFTNPSTVRDATTLHIGPPPTAGTNATLTNRWSLRVPSGKSNFSQIYAAGSVQGIGTTLADTYDDGARGFFNTGQISSSAAALVTGSNVNGNNTTGYGLIAGIRSSSSGGTNANGVAVVAELSMNPANTSGSWVNFLATGSLVVNGASVSSTGYSLSVTPNSSNVGGYNGGTYRGFYGEILSRSRQGFALVQGMRWAGLGGVGTSDNTTITNYNPIAISAGNLTEVTNYWSYIDHKTSIGASTLSTEELDVFGDARIRDSLRLTTTPAHTSISGLLTRDANGWVGLTNFSGLTYGGGVLTANSIYNNLPNGNVSIDADGNILQIENMSELYLSTTDYAVLETDNTRIELDDDAINMTADSEIRLFANSGMSRLYISEEDITNSVRTYNNTLDVRTYMDSSRYFIAEFVGSVIDQKNHLTIDFDKSLTSHSLRPYDKYGLANGTPSTTSGVKQTMVWTGTGGDATPAFERIASSSILDSLPNGSISLDANGNNLEFNNISSFFLGGVDGSGQFYFDDYEIALTSEDNVDIESGTNANPYQAKVVLASQNQSLVRLDVENRFGYNQVRLDSTDFTISEAKTGSTRDTLFKVDFEGDESGLVTLGKYTSAAPFTSLTVGEDATDLFLTTTSTTGKVIGKAMRQTTNVKDADLTITDNMLDLSMDIHVWAYCSNAASDSVVIDLPTPGTDYLGQMVSIYGDGRNATPNRDVYVRCVGAKLWHGNASPTGETYYQVTSLALARNSKTAEFTCVQNPDDNLYYWQLKQHP